MNTNLKIKKLKKEATKHITEYYAVASSYNCGLSLAEYMSFGMKYHKEKFNKIMDELAKLDPFTPPARL